MVEKTFWSCSFQLLVLTCSNFSECQSCFAGLFIPRCYVVLWADDVGLEEIHVAQANCTRGLGRIVQVLIGFINCNITLKRSIQFILIRKLHFGHLWDPNVVPCLRVAGDGAEGEVDRTGGGCSEADAGLVRHQHLEVVPLEVAWQELVSRAERFYSGQGGGDPVDCVVTWNDTCKGWSS